MALWQLYYHWVWATKERLPLIQPSWEGDLHRNKTMAADDRFQWQAGYGVFSLGERQLETAIAYVENQKQHHANNQIWTALEPPLS